MAVTRAQQPAQPADLAAYMRDLGRAARKAARELARADTETKNRALRAIAAEVRARSAELIEANRLDVARARKDGRDAAFVDRLTLDAKTVEQMAAGLEDVAALEDPVGRINGLARRPTGIEVGRMRVPIGVIGIIYESRPNVTADAAGLCLKAGNACILRGGSEALRSNRAIADCVRTGLRSAGLPEAAVQVVATPDRAAVGHLVTLTEYVDIIVPRGGKALIERLARESRIPMIKHLDGVCHVYIDDGADADMAVAIAVNAKTHRYGTCNTMETLLVAASAAAQLLPRLEQAYTAAGVELRGCDRTRAILPGAKVATEQDWREEYLAPILAVRVVGGIDEAIDHINTYSSLHTDSIVTRDHARAMRFLREVDSSSVMVNASTRFADGFEYGLGAEIGISTDKLHARGPMGLGELTTYKYIVFGNGQIRT